MQVLEIREKPRHPGRYSITFEPSGEKLNVSLDLIAELKLKPGKEVSEPDYARLQAGSRVIACYDKAVATLSARSRSAADLARWLKTKEFTDVEIAPAVEKLTALGLLDDVKYARTFAHSRLAPSRGYGPRRIAMSLSRKGVSRTVVDQVLAEYEAERAELAEEAEARGETLASAVEMAAAKKLRTLSKLEPEVQRRRLYGFLARRGFNSSEISNLLRRI